jgi:type IV pilus assembly protein PilP
MYAKARVVVLAAFVLGGCAPEQEDLSQWMARESSTMRGRVDPLPELKLFPVYSYDKESQQSPFAMARVEPERAAQPVNPLTPDVNRPKEPLESFNLESLRYVGILRRDGMLHGLVHTGTTIYPVRVGNHMGQDYGQITDISESGITLKEVVEDINGEWVERLTTLQLQEISTK